MERWPSYRGELAIVGIGLKSSDPPILRGCKPLLAVASLSSNTPDVETTLLCQAH